MTARLKDVAERAGVSIKTVSNVVNGRHARVGPRTREQVLAAINELHYRPNVAARHLRNARVGVLALAFPDLHNSYFAEVGEAIIAAAAEHSYTVLLDHTGAERANEALVVNGLRPHLFDGVIMDAQALNIDDIQPDRAGVPIVLLGEQLFGAPWDHVLVDNVAAARLATAHLLSLGRRRIAVIGVRQTSGAPALRLQGYTVALAEAGLAVDPRLLASVDVWHRTEGAEAMRRLLALPEPPDAVFGFNDLMALGAVYALREAGLRIPEDVAVVGFDDIEESRFSSPTLTTISPPKAEIGRLAVSMLVQRIEGTRTVPPAHVELAPQLVVRESTIGRAARPGVQPAYQAVTEVVELAERERG